ncbi:MAG: hypothetical protein M1837_005947 [Sclerophora amabilis]|nr:MAG: hypothetical protein M1837_005947 [Sclerophora amabilis]
MAPHCAATVTEPTRSSAAPSDVKDRTHHVKGGKGFSNPWESWRDLEGFKIGAALTKRRILGTANIPLTKPPTVTVQSPTFLPDRSSSPPHLRATWLGHACYFVEFPGGLRVLFDPVLEDRCSPVSHGQRYTPVPCQIEDIPFIDACIISHSHYDHLSLPTVQKIEKLHPNTHFFVPLGNKSWFNASGIDNVTELDWWDERVFQLPLSSNQDSGEELTTGPTTVADEIRATIGCLPCQHIANRGLTDRGGTLWSSWSVESGGKKLWFGGDTGYRAVPDLPKEVDDYGPGHDYPHCPAFKQIGDLRGPFDLGLIPIGAYDPRWIMSPMHANPFDSVNIFLETQCKRAMAMHWGTWVLTEEDVLEPPSKLKKALAWKGLPEEGIFDVCAIGESREFGD